MDMLNQAFFVLALVLPPILIACGAVAVLVTPSRARRPAPVETQEFVVH